MPHPDWLVDGIFSRLESRHASLFTSPRGGFRLDDGNPTWMGLSPAVLIVVHGFYEL